MRKIINPFVHIKDYNCFGCSPHNSFGLKMNFFEMGDDVICNWESKHHFSGYLDVLHGGIQSTLIDEIASWLVFVKLKTAGVTKKIDIDFLKPAYTSKGVFSLKASLVSVKKRIAEINVELLDGEKNICSRGIVSYFIYPENIAKEKLWFPGYEAFFEENKS